MDPLAFLYGMIASISVEAFKFYKRYEKGVFPKNYFATGFWAVRLVMALGAGFLATAYVGASQNYMLAFHVGASFPALLEYFSKEPPAGPATPSDAGARSVAREA